MVALGAKMVKVKICGITNVQDALQAVCSGSDALGFTFYKRSPRYITPKKACAIIRQLPARTVKIGVFFNARAKTIRQIARACHLDMIQLHGQESPAFCRKLKGLKIIKAFRVKTRLAKNDILRYNTCAYLFDSFTKAKPGGTGKAFNWKFIPHGQELKGIVFLSGGLDQNNVCKAIAAAHPEWVDVCSGVEARPGIKDHTKVKEFISRAKKVRA